MARWLSSAPLPPTQLEARHERTQKCYTRIGRQLCNGETEEADDALIYHATIWLATDFPFNHMLVVISLFGFRSIGYGFCSGVKASKIEFRGDAAQQLRSVGARWMASCPNLRLVTGYVEFTALEVIGNQWLHNCPKLGSVKLSAVPKLRKVGSEGMFQ